MTTEQSPYDRIKGFLEPLEADIEFYDKVRASKPNWKLVDEIRLNTYRGITFDVKAGQVMSFVLNEGPTVNDVQFLAAGYKSLHDEHFCTATTASIEGTVLRPNARLWSNVPWFRPMATYLDHNYEPDDLPSDEYSTVWHGSHCKTEVFEMAFDVKNLHSCHANFLEACTLRGLDETTARLDNVNVHSPCAMIKKTLPSGNEGYSITSAPLPYTKGRFNQFYAEIDLIVLVADCPNAPGGEPPMTIQNYPMDIEIYDTGIEPKKFQKWSDWRPAWREKMARIKQEGEPEERSRWFDK